MREEIDEARERIATLLYRERVDGLLDADLRLLQALSLAVISYHLGDMADSLDPALR